MGAFERYYADRHTRCQSDPGLERFEAAQGIATRTAVRSLQRIAELTFEDMDALQAGLGSEEGEAASTTSRTSPPAA